MRESQSDLWEMHRVPGHLVCISTNGFVKKNGCAVMGRGCALQATKLHPGIALRLGKYINRNGNVPGVLFSDKFSLGILPVKHNWWEKADLKLIQRSVEWLEQEAEEQAMRSLEAAEWHVIHVPRLGCGNGGRDWETEVRPRMVELPDSVVVHG